MIKVAGMYYAGKVPGKRYFLAVGDFYFTLTEDAFIRLGYNYDLAQITRLSAEMEKIAFSVPDLSRKRRFINLLKGTTKYGNSQDLVLASKAMYGVARDIHGDKVNPVSFSMNDFSDLMITCCHRIQLNCGKTLVEVNAHLLKTYDRLDIPFIKKLVDGTIFEKDVNSALPVLKTHGIEGLLQLHYYTEFSKKANKPSLVSGVLNYFGKK